MMKFGMQKKQKLGLWNKLEMKKKKKKKRNMNGRKQT